MLKVIKTWLGIQDSIELYMNHYQWWGDEYDQSTILIDPSMKIIAYFDRWSDVITHVQCDSAFNYPIIIENGKKRRIKEQISYVPMDYDRVIPLYIWEINKLKKEWRDDDVKNLYNLVREKVSEYNREYFLKIRRWITS